MNLLQHSRRWLRAVITLMVMLSVGGCSGITPDGKMSNEREEGPEQGLFSGPDGEFVIVAPVSSKPDKNAEEAKDQE
jgi:hypothetical protein